MLDIKYIRENRQTLQQAILDKRMKIDLDRLLSLDEHIRRQQIELELLQADRNRISKAIGVAPGAEREPLKAQVHALKPRLEALELELKQVSAEFDSLMLLVPAPARSDVPIGKDDSELWDMIDVERGVKLAGSRSYVLKGLGAQLEQAVLRYTLDYLNAKGYTQLSIPVLVKEEAMVGTGYFPIGRDQAYLVERDDMVLIGTSEVSLTSYHAGEILKNEQLPLRYMAQSTCFRREAGREQVGRRQERARSADENNRPGEEARRQA